MNPKPILTHRIWIAVALLAFSGQLAWGVENQFFNTFLYNTITPDPRPVSWMVAASAVTATVTTLLMGTLSDRTRSRWGRRKPFLLFGYLTWGVMTALFPSAAFFKPVGLAIAMAILFDCLMTFCGSTANDAALNAYVTDVTTGENRGRVMSVVELLTWVAILIVYGGSGLLIENLGYFAFFYIIGGLVFVLGLVGGLLVQEERPTDVPQKSYWKQLTEAFQWRTLTANRDFFLVLLGISLWAVAQNVFFPYLIIYLQHYLQLDTMTATVTIAISILVGGIAMAWPLGLLVDRWGRKPVALLAVGAEMVGLVLFSLSRTLAPLLITGILWLIPLTAWTSPPARGTRTSSPKTAGGSSRAFTSSSW